MRRVRLDRAAVCFCSNDPDASGNPIRITMTATRTPSVHGAGERCGVRISRTASNAMPNAAPINMIDTTAAAIASALP